MTITTAPGLTRYRYTDSHARSPFYGVRIGEFVVTLRAKGLHETNSYRSKTRVFGACDELVADLNAIEPTYIPRTDDRSTDVERVQEKMWRAWRDNTKRVAQARLTELLIELAEQPADDRSGLVLPDVAELTALRFSYRAGCSSCPCSPGFIMGGLIRIGYTPQDIWITPVSKLTEVVA
jgi:hypothetical protein